MKFEITFSRTKKSGRSIPCVWPVDAESEDVAREAVVTACIPDRVQITDVKEVEVI